MQQFIKTNLIRLIIILNIVILLLFTFILVNIIKSERETTIKEYHSEQVITHVKDLLQGLITNESGSRGYIITGDKYFLEPFNKLSNEFTDNLIHLKQLVKDNTEQRIWMDSLQFYCNKRLEHTRELTELRNNGELKETEFLVESGIGFRYGSKIRFFGNLIITEENRLLKWQKLEHEKTIQSFIIYLIGMIILAAFLFTVILILIRRDKKRQEKTGQEIRNFAKMIDESSEAIFSRGLDQKIISWNKGAEQLLGFNREEAIGRTTLDLNFTRFTPEEITTLINELNEKGVWKTERYLYPKNNGKPFYGIATANTLKNEKNEIIAYFFIIKDITAIKEREQILHQSNEELETLVLKRTEEIKKNELLFRALIENNEEGFSLTDVNGNTIYRSPASIKLMGNVPRENATLVTHPDDINLFIEKKQECISNPGIPIPFTGRFKHADGYYLWLEGSFTNLLNIKEINGIISNFRNITQRKEYENSIIKSENQYRNLVEGITDGFLALDRDLRVSFLNKTASVMFNKPAEELLGFELYAIFNDARESSFYNAFEEVINTGRKTYLEAFSPIFNRWLQANIYPSENGVFALFRDITQSRDLQKKLNDERERFSKIALSSGDCFWEVNEKGEYIYCSDKIDQFTGFKEAELMGKSILFAVEDQDLLLVENHFKFALQQQAEIKEIQYRIRHRNGQQIWLATNAYPKQDDKGNFTGYIGTHKDITEQKNSEISLRESNSQLQLKTIELTNTNTELDRFAYVASHDLQEPLRMVTNFLQLLLMKYNDRFDDTGKKYIHFAIDGAARMKDLIRDLLQYSRAGSGTLELSAIDLNDIINDVLLLFRQEIMQTNAEIHFKNLPVIKASRTAMLQLFQNLLSNALKYKSSAKPVITINCIETGQEWIIRFIDNGIGIAPEYFNKIFIIFQRLHRKEEFSGTGIGLSICKKIVERFNGNIRVESELGKGSSFIITLPKDIGQSPEL